MADRPFRDRTVVVLASGPSLTQTDIETVHGCRTVAVNSTWEKARFCDVIFAADNRWWIHNHELIDIPARRVTLSYRAPDFGAERFRSLIARHGYNSGCLAIEYALCAGAERVLLLGFDCSVKDGAHHHGSHGLWPDPTAMTCMIWKQQFERLRKVYADAEIINCSRRTALECFPRADLESALCGRG